MRQQIAQPSPISNATVIEARLLEIFLRRESVDAIKDAVHRESGPHVFVNLIQQATDLNLPTDKFDKLVSVLQDAWNYFPHQRLGDISPAEKLGQLTTGHSRTPDSAWRTTKDTQSTN